MTRCFVCNRPKEESNHWWAVYLSLVLPGDKNSFHVLPLASAAGTEESSYKTACGNQCAAKLLERYLQTGKLDAPKAGVSA